MDGKMQIDYLPIDILKGNSWNPNKQKDDVFNKLVENIEEIGFVEPVMVRPLENGDYEIVSGHHRVEAAKIVGMDEVPCIVQQEFDEDMTKFQLVRMNVLRGELDPQKFTALFNDMADKYGEELTKDMMAMMDEKAFEKLYIDVKKELPKDLADKLDKTKKEIKDVDGLSRILNNMFSTYGDTLDYNFMVFSYGNKQHYWIQMDNSMKKQMDKVHEIAMGHKIDINELFGQIFTGDEAKATLQELHDTLPEDAVLETDEEDVNFE